MKAGCYHNLGVFISSLKLKKTGHVDEIQTQALGLSKAKILL